MVPHETYYLQFIAVCICSWHKAWFWSSTGVCFLRATRSATPYSTPTKVMQRLALVDDMIISSPLNLFFFKL